MYLHPDIKICVTSLQGLIGSPVKPALLFMHPSCAEGTGHLLPETFRALLPLLTFLISTCKLGKFFLILYLFEVKLCIFISMITLLRQCASGSATHLVSGTWDMRTGLSRCLMTDPGHPVQPPPPACPNCTRETQAGQQQWQVLEEQESPSHQDWQCWCTHCTLRSIVLYTQDGTNPPDCSRQVTRCTGNHSCQPIQPDTVQKGLSHILNFFPRSQETPN